jgi:RNase P subunit RPR2
MNSTQTNLTAAAKISELTTAANGKNSPSRVAGETKAKTAAAVITCGHCGHEIRMEAAAAALGARGGRAKVRKGFAVTGQIKRKGRE